MKNIDIAENLYYKITHSREFLNYKHRWKNLYLFYTALFFIFSLLLFYFKNQGFIDYDVSLKPLIFINVLNFFIFIHSFYNNSYDNAIIRFYYHNKDTIHRVEKKALENYLQHSFKRNSLFETKKSHFLIHITDIINKFPEKDKEEISIVSNLNNF